MIPYNNINVISIREWRRQVQLTYIVLNANHVVSIIIITIILIIILIIIVAIVVIAAAIIVVANIIIIVTVIVVTIINVVVLPLQRIDWDDTCTCRDLAKEMK